MPLRCLVLLPCDSLKEIPLDLSDEETDAFFTSWVAPWDPLLLHAAGKLPGWTQAMDPAENPRELMVFSAAHVLPLAPEAWLETLRAFGRLVSFEPSEGLTEAETCRHQASLIRGDAPSAETGVASLGTSNRDAETLYAEIRRDFAALGYCYLLVEMLTRRMRYISNVDWVRLERQTLAAAAAVVAGDASLARSELRGAFEALAQAKDQFYPATAYLCDLVLTAPSTLGEGLARQLAAPHPFTLLAAGRTLEELAARHPTQLEKLRERVLANQITLLCGPDDELELPLLPLDALLEHLEQGRRIYMHRIGAAPKFFGMRRYGLTPVLPACLKSLGYQAAYHNACDDGVFPLASQCLSRWQGLGPGSLQALFRPPQDAWLAGTYLCYAENLGHTMDVDHVATLGFAHWPNRVSRWHDLLNRAAAYCSPVGEFVHLERYFREADLHGYSASFKPDAYETPYLTQDVDAGNVRPISRWPCYYRQRRTWEELRTLLFFQEQITGRSLSSGTLEMLRQRIASQLLTRPQQGLAADEGCLDEELGHALRQAREELTRRLSQSEGGNGWLRINATTLPDQGTPALGYHWRSSEESASTHKTGSRQLLVEVSTNDGAPVLENGRLRVCIHPETGGVQSIERIGKRGNHFSQHLAYRSTQFGSGEHGYLKGHCTQWETVQDAKGQWVQVVAKGIFATRSGENLANFKQTTRLFAMRSLVELRFDFENLKAPTGDPWKNYIASRVAWGDGAAQLYRGVAGFAHPTSADSFCAPEFIEVDGLLGKAAILTGGLPYHVLRDTRKLDTLLIVQGETQSRDFCQALTVGLTSAPALAHAWQVENEAISARAPRHESGWFFHVDQPGVMPIRWWSLCEKDQIIGLGVLLQNTAELPAAGLLRTFRPPRQAREFDLTGEELADMEICEAGMHFHLEPFEWGIFHITWR